VSLDVRGTWDQLLGSDPGSPGILRRRMFPDSAVDVFLGIAWPSRSRLLVLQVDNGVLDVLGDPVSTRAVRTSVIEVGDNRSEIRLELAAPDMLDVFVPFVEDVAECAAAERDDQGAVRALRDRFDRWRLLLAGLPASALGPSEAQGFWGELWVLRNVLQPRRRESTPDFWTAGDPDEKDFRLDEVSVEVKTTRMGHPQVVRINGENQLDAPGAGGAVLLVIIEADVHEGGTGETLNEAVRSARDLFTGTAGARLEDRLLQRGYRDSDDAAYHSTHYAVRNVFWHEVAEGFPRITAGDLPIGVGDVRYLLSVDACAAWRIDEERLGALLGTPQGAGE
jgi:hypothetical protein